MPNLSTELHQAFHENADREEEFDIRDTYAAQFAAVNTPESWDAPGMELYDDYDAHKPRS